MPAGFCQGVILGGIPVHNGAFAGGTFHFLSSFAVVCGLGLIAGYALLGATWLIFKTSGTTGDFGRRAARPALLVSLAFIALISLWTPISHTQIAQRWFSWPNIGFLWPVPIATALIAYRIWREIAGGHDARPFLLSIALFLMAFVGLGISLWPYTVPYAATLWQAASSEAALEFVGIGVVVTVPFILAYFGYAHWIFRGKTGVMETPVRLRARLPQPKCQRRSKSRPSGPEEDQAILRLERRTFRLNRRDSG